MKIDVELHYTTKDPMSYSKKYTKRKKKKMQKQHQFWIKPM